MKKIAVTLILSVLFLAGCETLRFAPSEKQKQNAWLHNRTAEVAAQVAQQEKSSEQLQSLTKLSQLQSRSFTTYFGQPKETPQAYSANDILAESNWLLAYSAVDESAERPNVFELADNMFELAIGVCALLGGVYGTRAVRFLKDAQAKSKALKEIVTANEIFKSTNSQSAEAFKQAQQIQSAETRQLVAQLKS